MNLYVAFWDASRYDKADILYPKYVRFERRTEQWQSFRRGFPALHHMDSQTKSLRGLLASLRMIL